MAYYNYDRILSYNALFNFILSPRGNGKSYGGKERCIKRFLKNGEQFVYVRRYKEELKKINLFFDDIREKFPNDKLEIKGKNAYINGKLAGHFLSLSTSQKEKSTSYPYVTTILFDEFIIDKGHIRYLTNEVEVFLDLYETIARKRENVKAIFLANNVSIVNPYFLYFKCIPKDNNRFTLAKNGLICVEMFTDEDFINEKSNTAFGQLISGTQYGDYAILNKSLRDNDAFIQPYKPQNASFLFSIIYKGFETGIWISYKEGICYVCSNIQKSSRNRFSITKEDHDINYLMYNSLSSFGLFKEFVKYYKLGFVRFKNIEMKNRMYEIMAYMNIK